MARIEQRPERYLHSPRLSARSDGGATLHLIAWQGEGERVLRFPIAPDGSVGEPEVGAPLPAIVALTRGDDVLASGDSCAELEETRAGQRVWIEFAHGISNVYLRRKYDLIPIFRGRGSAAAPCLWVTPRGTWVAFHHDVREDDRTSDVSKWIALRFVDHDGVVMEPAEPMTERDRDREGVEQSFEFPALIAGPNGAISLFGRGSHNYWRQDLDQEGFTPRMPLSDGEWGSRGRHIAVAPHAAGLVIARRDRKGIEVDVAPLPMGDAPALTLARVDWIEEDEDEHPATYVERAGRPDPAHARGMVTLFGDIQQHSAHSDGVGSADEVYQRARYRYRDDFVALTDHEAFLGKRTGPGEWEYLQEVADRYDAPGAFVTLLAYEWTGKMFPGPGHKCVYYPQRGLPIVSRDDVPEGKALVQKVRALGGFAAPHHIGWTGADEAGHDDEGQPTWEICSCHGCYEHAEHPLGQRGELRDQMVDVMLRRGHRFGFTGSSDSHGLLWHHGEARKRDPYRTGLTAVQAREVSRAAVMEALRERRCYATSGAKILLELSADGAPMGSVLEHAKGAHFTVRAQGTDRLRALEVVGPEGVLAHAEALGDEAALDVHVEAPWAYARVIQEDGEMAWSSPVFFGPSPLL